MHRDIPAVVRNKALAVGQYGNLVELLRQAWHWHWHWPALRVGVLLRLAGITTGARPRIVPGAGRHSVG